MKKIAFFLFGIATLVLLLLDFNLSIPQDTTHAREYFESEVQSVELSEDEVTGDKFQLLEVSLAGETHMIENSLSAFANPIEYEVGDKVTIVEYQVLDGENYLYVTGHVRRPALIQLFLFFTISLLIVNGRKGVLALTSLAFSFLVIFKLILPLIMNSWDPVLVALLGAVLILPVSFYISHGIDKKSTVAMLGTLIALGITGLMSFAFSNLTELSGIASEEASFLSLMPDTNIDFQGLLLAGMIISVLGVLDDVSITQASVVRELMASHPSKNTKKIFSSAMQVGRDHIASVVNTLILVYTGASLPLLLLFFGSQSMTEVLNFEFIAEEIVRTLVGSIGLIAAVPITTFIAVIIFNKYGVSGVKKCSHSH